MLFKFLWIGSTRNPLLKQLEEEYLKRLQRYASIRRETVREVKKSSRTSKAAFDKEALAIEKKLSPGDYLVVMDHRGRDLKSTEFARFLNQKMVHGVSDLTFLIGGHLGIPESIRERAQQTMALSRMTMPHDLARVVLLEQVYRAMTILKGTPYHK